MCLFFDTLGYGGKNPIGCKHCMNRSLNMFRTGRTECEEICVSYAYPDIEMFRGGDMELTEVSMPAALARNVPLESIRCSKTNRKHLGTMPDFQDVDMFDTRFDEAIAHIYEVDGMDNAQECYHDLGDCFGADLAATPLPLCLTTSLLQDALLHAMPSERV